MADLILRPDIYKDGHYALQIRRHDCCGPTDYETLKRGLTESEARDIVDCGKPYWLFGDPIEKPAPKRRKICDTCGHPEGYCGQC